MTTKSIRHTLIAAAIALTTAAPVMGATVKPFGPDATMLSDDIAYDVHADGTHIMEETERVRIDSDRGIKRYAQMSLHCSTSLEALDVLEAYTTTKDGKRLDVAPDKIIVQQSPQSAGAPTFDDGKVKTVVFSDVTVGSTVTLHVRKTQKQAMFPGQFSAIEHFGDDKPIESARVTLRAPASLTLHVDARGMQGGRTAPDAPGMQRWQWTLEHTSAHVPELGSVSVADRDPYVAMTTFADFPAVGAAYLTRAEPKTAVTPSVRELADSLTKGVTDRRKQAEILYNWVSENVRYVAIYLGFGGLVPHEASDILAARYGDCKDHVTLLEALLAAKGIKSSPVLVNAGATYRLPKVAAPLGVFDHAITYLPEFKLYVDSTPGFARFGTLPIVESGKPALVADDGSGRAAIVTLPQFDAKTASVQVTTKVALDSDGNAKGTSEIDNMGAFDWITREFFSSIAPGVEPEVASRMLTLTGQSGTGTFTHTPVHDLTQPFVYKAEFELPAYASFPGPGAMRVSMGLGSLSGISTAFEQCAATTRDFGMPVVSRHVSETTIVTLPDGVTIANLPKPADIESPFGSYASKYTRDGRTVTVTRTLDLALPGPVLEPEQYPAFRKMGLAVMRDLGTQLVY
ncbi:DUF3857 domain-containing protein [Trinickia fusca]|uniref:DUF3857 domain-containing protein n=1 Tax=Trinickia fusca TaxID=2419777 RepID=A0A494XK12_9BURK|nr:DUF3857 domain-containing protein [Trinickia fusca]RKP51065.1 DUF3857 domain-containing protein [Trinickia fusca]